MVEANNVERFHGVLVSVVIPTRNRCDLLKRALDSVFAQTYPHIEVVVVNDGSTDGTRQFLDNLKLNDVRVKVVHHENNVGAASSRNRAVAESTGLIVTGLDDDDEFTPDRIHNFVLSYEQLTRENRRFSCLFSELLLFDNGRLQPGQTAISAKVDYLDLFEANLIGNQIFCLKSRLVEVGGYDDDLRAWEDIDVFIRLLMAFGPAIRVGSPTYICHADFRRDRISKGAKNLRLAFERMNSKYVDIPLQYRLCLFSQLFSPFHGIIPTYSDWAFAVRCNADALVYRRLARAYVDVVVKMVKRK